MKAYYIHWSYPASADDQLYYSGEDDERLFHHEENAINKAKEIMAEIQKDIARYKELCNKAGKEWYGGHCPYLSPEEEAEYYNLRYTLDESPTSYTIYVRNIIFEDEE